MCDLSWGDPVWLMRHIVKNPKLNFVRTCFSHYGDRRSQKTKVKLFSSSSPQCFEWKVTEHLRQCEPALMCAAWIMNAIDVKAADLWGCAFSGLYALAVFQTVPRTWVHITLVLAMPSWMHMGTWSKWGQSTMCWICLSVWRHKAVSLWVRL